MQVDPSLGAAIGSESTLAKDLACYTLIVASAISVKIEHSVGVCKDRD